jgi:RNA polymerase II-associated factor 1
LRRTEYITSHRNDKVDASSALRTSRTPKRAVAAKPVAPSSREGIIRQIQKSFNIAYPRDAYTGTEDAAHMQGAEVTRPEREAWAKPKHPTDADVTLVDSYPVLPDLHALPDTGSYMIVKYSANPSHVSDRYDTKLDYVLLQPREPTEEQMRKFKKEEDDYKAGKLKYVPMPISDFTAYIPEGDSQDVVPKLKRKYNVFDEDKDDEDLYTNFANQPCFPFSKLRVYETSHRTGSQETMWDDSLVVSLHDDLVGQGASKRQKAAYIYPIIQRVNLKQHRQQTDRQGRMIRADTDGDIPDVLEVTVGEWDDESKRGVQDSILQNDPEAVFDE